ncbi:MAG: DTW domain-containing protein [Deltaproteobacteria bacterium]|nr:DTW domain-containing protein [Deltaproteobacteria bacterium]
MSQNLPALRLAPGRCIKCRLLQENCLCATLPHINTRTRLLIVIHWRDYVRLSNSGQLAAQMLQQAELRVRGLPGGSFVEDSSAEAAAPSNAERRLLLYAPSDVSKAPPSHAAARLDETHRAKEGETVTLLVPDGSWTQTRRMVRREPVFAHAEMVTLPPGPASRYQLRHAPAAEMVSTLEAVARALTLLEDDPSIETRMLAFFEPWVERMLMGRRSNGAPFQNC